VKVAIVDYGAGNLRSAAKAFALAGAEVVVTADPREVARADRIVLPGDGAFADCRAGLAAVDGMDEAIDEAVHGRAVPFLGICVGMQLLATEGREHGVTRGLGWIPGAVDKITPADPRLKVPHMGWNTLRSTRAHALTAGIPLGPDGLHAFFLHGYHMVLDDPADLVATADYGGAVTAIVARGNIAGAQFHPEKSQTLGLALVSNFLAWRP
jgi:imidazole glycerol-phosphate synthase subunit HisH